MNGSCRQQLAGDAQRTAAKDDRVAYAEVLKIVWELSRLDYAWILGFPRCRLCRTQARWHKWLPMMQSRSSQSCV